LTGINTDIEAIFICINIMSDIESRIQSSYDRLPMGSVVYLLRDESANYEELPNPDEVSRVYKADVIEVAPDYMRGIYLVSRPDFSARPTPDEAGPLYAVSPREVFNLNDLYSVIRERTSLPRPRPNKLDKILTASKRGRFGEILAPEMARIVIERFAEDPRDGTGRLINKR
jgi:hypothetical protein